MPSRDGLRRSRHEGLLACRAVRTSDCLIRWTSRIRPGLCRASGGGRLWCETKGKDEPRSAAGRLLDNDGAPVRTGDLGDDRQTEPCPAASVPRSSPEPFENPHTIAWTDARATVADDQPSAATATTTSVPCGANETAFSTRLRSASVIVFALPRIPALVQGGWAVCSSPWAFGRSGANGDGFACLDHPVEHADADCDLSLLTRRSPGAKFGAD